VQQQTDLYIDPNSTVTRDIFTRAVAVILDTTLGIGTKRKIPTSSVRTVEEGTDLSMLTLSKTILESKTLEAIKSLMTETRRHVTSLATPSSMFRSGVYMLSLDLLREADTYLVEQQAKLAELVAKFKAEYLADKMSAKIKLGPMFDEGDYPPVERVDAAIKITWAYVSVEIPKTVDAISADIYQREQVKAAERWESAFNEASVVLRGGFAQLIDHMVERLALGEDGKPRIFRDSLVSNIREWLRTFPSRNLADDAELGRLAREAETLLSGVTPESLRDVDALRDKVRDGMTTIKARLDATMVESGARKYGVQ
jgi:hypothetical protein